MNITITNQRLHQAENSIAQKSQICQAGDLRNRVVTFVVLGAATALSLTAAVVATVFASYLLAAICAAATLISIVATLLVGRIKTTQPSAPKLPEINIQKTPQPNTEKENLELKKQIADLKAALESKTEKAPPSQSHELTEKQAKIEEQAQVIESLQTENQRLLTELEELKTAEEELNTEEQMPENQNARESVESEGHSSERESINDTQTSVSTEPSNEEVTQQNDELSLRKIKTRLFKSNKNKKEEKLTEKEQEYLSKDLKPNNISKKEYIIEYFAVMKNIEELEGVKGYTGSFDIAKEAEKGVGGVLNELRNTEIQFQKDIQSFNTFLSTAMNEKVISHKKFSKIIKNINMLIAESQILIENLPDSQLSIEKSMQKHYEAFTPHAIKKYYEAFIKTVPKTNFLGITLNKMSENSKGKKLIDNFNNRPDGLTLEQFFVKMAQRITKHPLLLRELIKAAQFKQADQKEAFDRNLSYMTLNIERMNILNSNLEPTPPVKKRVPSGVTQSSN